MASNAQPAIRRARNAGGNQPPDAHETPQQRCGVLINI
jgi:hypothetical protein